MAGKEDKIELEGEVIEAFRNGMYKIKLDNGHETLGYTAGKMRRYRIKILPGDRINIELAVRPHARSHRLPPPVARDLPARAASCASSWQLLDHRNVDGCPLLRPVAHPKLDRKARAAADRRLSGDKTLPGDLEALSLRSPNESRVLLLVEEDHGSLHQLPFRFVRTGRSVYHLDRRPRRLV